MNACSNRSRATGEMVADEKPIVDLGEITVDDSLLS